MIEISESNVIFGPFDEDFIFLVEKSPFLPTNVKAVEFVWFIPSKAKLVLVEAKSSFSQPTNSSCFDENLQDIYKKLVDSLVVMVMSKLGRHSNIYQELPESFQTIDWNSVDICLRLVIPAFQDEWLSPITDALRQRMKHFLSAFGIKIQNLRVLNKRLAMDEGLLKPEHRLDLKN